MQEEKHLEGELNEAPPAILKPDDLLSILSSQIKTLDQKLSTGRIRNRETERVRIHLVKTLSYATQVFCSVERDVKISQLEERVSALEVRE